MNKAYLLTGGNLGNRPENIALADEFVKKFCGEITEKSAIYESAPWGYTDQPAFYNRALGIATLLEPDALMEQILFIESKMGRQRLVHMGPRTIDIDILFYNSEVINIPGLIIPHPRMQERRFVLAPLAEIAPGFIHPLFLKSIGQLLHECPDKLDVHKIQ